jgi:hypothetical protein
MTELDCSDGARMLIERMQTNPEDFSYAGKLYRAINTDQMSTRDIRAYNDAHDRYIKEPRLMAEVLKALLVPPEEEEMRAGTQGPIAGTTVNKMWFDEVTDTARTHFGKLTREQFEDHIQTHKSPIKKHIEAVAAEKESIAAQIYTKAFGREKVERDN